MTVLSCMRLFKEVENWQCAKLGSKNYDCVWKHWRLQSSTENVHGGKLNIIPTTTLSYY